MAKIYDCVMYNGESHVLTIRLNELTDLADIFVLVESDTTFSGMAREIAYSSSDERFSHFKDRIRHIVVRDMPKTDDPWVREAWQRNAVLRGLHDVAADDVVVLSDADEIPRASILREIAAQNLGRACGLRMQMSYFYLNYCIIDGPDFRTPWAAVVPAAILRERTPQQWRDFIRDESSSAIIVHNGGWHFSYLSDLAGVKRKIAQFSHQEFNNDEFLQTIDIDDIVSKRDDLFRGRGHAWAIKPPSTLPACVQANRVDLARFILPVEAQAQLDFERKFVKMAEDYEVLRRGHIRIKEHNAELQHHNSELKQQNDAINEIIDQKNKVIDENVATISGLRVAINDNAATMTRLHEDLERLYQALEEKSALALRVGLEVRDMHRSLSWRLTAPVRSVQKRLGKAQSDG